MVSDCYYCYCYSNFDFLSSWVPYSRHLHPKFHRKFREFLRVFLAIFVEISEKFPHFADGGADCFALPFGPEKTLLQIATCLFPASKLKLLPQCGHFILSGSSSGSSSTTPAPKLESENRVRFRVTWELKIAHWDFSRHLWRAGKLRDRVSTLALVF